MFGCENSNMMDSHGVKIRPSTVEFYDAETHCVHQMKLSVQNLSKKSQHIRFCQPESDVSNFGVIEILFLGS